ncbi:MAG: hypothetical protein ACRDF0_10435, partial [Candidatus Limnocylindria bacterium]
DVLLALGVREAAARPAADVAGAIERLRAQARRSAVDTLLDPRGLGAFQVHCFAKDAPIDGLRMFAAERPHPARLRPID